MFHPALKVLPKVQRSFNYLFFALVFIFLSVLVGTIGMMYFEHLSLLDAVYFTVVTIGTIGYGDIYPLTAAGKMFLIFFIPLGVSTFLYTLGALTVAIFEGQFMEVFHMEQQKETIRQTKNHTILCGYGDVGEYIAQHVDSLVVIESKDERFHELRRNGLLGIHGDSTEPDVLKEAHIEDAAMLIVALNDDPKTVFTVLIAKELNPSIKIYARANRKDSVNKIRLAGADEVLCLPEIGGREFLKAIEKNGSREKE